MNGATGNLFPTTWSTIYVKEDAIVPRLDEWEWIATLFNEMNLDATCEALEMATFADPGAEAARRKIGRLRA